MRTYEAPVVHWTGNKVLMEACQVDKPPITPRAKRFFIVVTITVALGCAMDRVLQMLT